MPESPKNKFRIAVAILQRGRDRMIDELADAVIDGSDELVEGGFTFYEFLENQGTRIHFATLLVAQLEQAAEAFDELHSPPPPLPPAPASRPRKPRSRKVGREAAAEPAPEEG